MTADLSTQWATVKGALLGADSIAFDGCHKIYVLMDAGQTAQMISYGYRDDDSKMLLRSEGATTEQMLESLKEWFDDSCGLRFINAVRTVEGNPNDGFTQLIAQFEGVEPEEEDDDDKW